ncbi:MAG TPA: PspC domain-containing protein [Candidatus Paceibacterota bacterium]|nr:PspC domain-containing protein [Candidatus Paceibacterota bacterium]
MQKKLYRSREHRVLMGLCGGVAAYFAVDPNLVRLIYMVLTVITGVFPGIIAYLLGIFIVPLEPTVERMETIIVDDGTDPTAI